MTLRMLAGQASNLSEAVGVRAVVETHLGREPTRSELEAILVEHVSTGRLVAVRDPPPPMDDDTPKRRHVWVDASGGGHKYPGLVIAWRRRDDGWEGYVAMAPDGSVLITWEQATRLHPVVNDVWQLPPPGLVDLRKCSSRVPAAGG